MTDRQIYEMKETSIVEQLKFDTQAKSKGTRIEDYDVYKKSKSKELAIVFLGLGIYFLLGLFLGIMVALGIY